RPPPLQGVDRGCRHRNGPDLARLRCLADHGTKLRIARYRVTDGDGPPGRINILPSQGTHLARAHRGGDGHPVKGVQLGILTDVCHDLASLLLRPCLLLRSRPLWPTDAAYRVTGH